MWRREPASGLDTRNRRAVLCVLVMAALAQRLPGAGGALEPGVYTLKLRGRSTCLRQGFMTAPLCGSSNLPNIIRADAGTGQQWWEVTAVDGGSNIEGVPVLLKSVSRTACGAYATYPAGCLGRVTLQARQAGLQRQHWVLAKQADGTLHIRPQLCPRKLLSYSTECSVYRARLAVHSAGWNDWTLGRPPSSVAVVAFKTQDWGSGYQGAILLTNFNSYAVLDWALSFAFEDYFSDEPAPTQAKPLSAQQAEQVAYITEFTRERVGSKVTIKPPDYLKTIPAGGGVLRIEFCSRSLLPHGFAFTQLLPPRVPPDQDPALLQRGTFGAKVFSPYLDTTLWPVPDLAGIANQTGQLFYTLAFITAKGTQPAWGSAYTLDTYWFYDTIRRLRLSHGDVIVSFGGEAGTELAAAITDVPSLVAAYQSVIDLYQLRWADFDIEGGALAQPEVIDRRNQAIKILQDNNPGLTVSYCLPVLPTGLTTDGEALLRNATYRGVRVDVVQIMAMCYGDAVAPDPEGKMGAYAKQAAQATYAQAVAAGIANPKIGIIPMIGKNYVESEVFRLADACEVARFAGATAWVRATSFWSVARDNFNPAENNTVSATSSGIPQAPYAFTQRFRAPYQACPPPT